MSDFHPEDPSTTPAIQVTAIRDGVEIHRELCETEQEAAAVVAHWEENRGVECEVIDLSADRYDESAGQVDRTGEDAAYPAADSEQG